MFSFLVALPHHNSKNSPPQVKTWIGGL